MTSAQSWSRDWADVITGLSRRHPYRFSDGCISISTKHYYIYFLCSSKTVTNYIYAKIQAEICMFTSQNSRGLNRAILRPLWLMTSVAANVISDPRVPNYDNQIIIVFIIISIKMFTNIPCLTLHVEIFAERTSWNLSHVVLRYCLDITT